MRIRYFNQWGEEIEKDRSDPYKYRKNPKEYRPQDYVMIKQLEIEEAVTDLHGQQQMITKLSDPIEEVYCGWVWDNESWNCLVRLVIKKQEIILDRRPVGWRFLEIFNQNRPNFRNG